MLIKPAILHFKFDRFADLTPGVDHFVSSYLQTDCNGNEWSLDLCRGVESEATQEGFIALYLCNEGEESLDTKYRFGLKNANGTVVHKAKQCGINECACEANRSHVFYPWEGFGCDQYMKRDDILDPKNNILKDGALCVDVTIQVKDKKDEHYDPENKLTKKMLNLLKSGERSDASFKVGGCTFPVHLNILHNNAPILASHLPEARSGYSAIIEGMSSAVFKLVLEFVYAELRPTDAEVLKHGKELIDAANRYELVDLKMVVEHVLVRERILTTENVSDYILFADAQSCPLLKEYAMTYLIPHAEEVLKSEHSKRLRESGELLAEVVIQMSRSNEGDDTLCVNELRKELRKRELNVDGSKEVLMTRLQEANEQRTD